MTKKVLNLSLLVALVACLLQASSAEYPAIDELEGFEVDMEPFWVDFDREDTNPAPLDIQGYFRTEMMSLLPNVMGVILQSYENTVGDTTHTFYTGMAVFRGPPFRTNHDVFMAQTSALTSLQAAASFLHVHNASMGVPPWFDTALLGDKNVKMDEATDEMLNSMNNSNERTVSMGTMIMGVSLGLVIGACMATVAILCPRVIRRRRLEVGTHDSPGHKRKVSNDLSFQDVELQGDTLSINSNNNVNGNGIMEKFCDEEEELPSSPKKRIQGSDSATPLKRRPSHHRRWKSSAFHDMQSPASVMDGVNGLNSVGNNSNHRRSNSMAGPRRPSMVELLSVDMEDLMGDYDQAEFNDD